MDICCQHRQSQDLKRTKQHRQARLNQYNLHLNLSPILFINRTGPKSSQILPHLTNPMMTILKLNLNLSSPAPSKSKGDQRSG